MGKSPSCRDRTYRNTVEEQIAEWRKRHQYGAQALAEDRDHRVWKRGFTLATAPKNALSFAMANRRAAQLLPWRSPSRRRMPAVAHLPSSLGRSVRGSPVLRKAPKKRRNSFGRERSGGANESNIGLKRNSSLAASRDQSVMQCIYGYFKDNPHGFENCAASHRSADEDLFQSQHQRISGSSEGGRNLLCAADSLRLTIPPTSLRWVPETRARRLRTFRFHRRHTQRTGRPVKTRRRFTVLRQTMGKRMGAKLSQIYVELKRRMHAPISD